MLNTNRSKYYILIFILIILIGIVSTINHQNEKDIFLKIQSAIKVVQKTKIKLVLTHLWFEELINGDNKIKISFIENSFDNMISQTNILLANSILINNTKQISTITQEIEELKKLTLKRYELNFKSGTQEDQVYDQLFNKILDDFIIIGEEIDDISIRNKKDIEDNDKILFFIYIGIIIILFILIKYIEKDLKTTVQDNKEKEQLIYKSEKLASMGEMIGNIAHQWRQPLSVISTAATGIKMQKEFNKLSDKDLNNFCDAINDNAQYLSKTIDDFRNFIKNNRKKENFELSHAIKSFLNIVNSSIQRHNIDVVFDVKQDVTIYGYENELIQALMNIFNNAKDELVSKKQNSRHIYISIDSKNDKAIIKIKDNAGGISKKIINNIFEPYFTTKHKSQGTGLGLSMAYNIIKGGMNGNIEVENRKFKYKDDSYTGALFIITIPIL